MKEDKVFVPLLERIEEYLIRLPQNRPETLIVGGHIIVIKSNILECLRELDNDLKLESLRAESNEQSNESIAYSNARMYLKRRFGKPPKK